VLLRTAFLLCGGDRGAAEDLLQEVLERSYPRWPRIRDAPEPYLRAALANAAANGWRARSRRVSEVPIDNAREDTRTGHEQQIVEHDRVVRALRRLPPRMRAVLVLRYFDDMSEADIAKALRRSTGTVWQSDLTYMDEARFRVYDDLRGEPHIRGAGDTPAGRVADHRVVARSPDSRVGEHDHRQQEHVPSAGDRADRQDRRDRAGPARHVGVDRRRRRGP
jgi:RNA polymerase sigma factor (sigma-70 family)